MNFQRLIDQAATAAETACAEPTTLSGLGTVSGIVDRMSAERMLKRGEFGGAGEGVVTVVYLRTLFTDAQIRQLRSSSVVIPSVAGATPLAISSVEHDATWVTILAQVR